MMCGPRTGAPSQALLLVLVNQLLVEGRFNSPNHQLVLLVDELAMMALLEVVLNEAPYLTFIVYPEAG